MNGPLIMVVQFIGFLAGWNNSAALGPVLGAYFTFLPSFMFIFLGAPYIERLIGNPRLSAVLATITPAVVGVILSRRFFGHFNITPILGNRSIL